MPSNTTSSTAPHGKSVLVTGAAKRLGREIALHLAAEGWRVAVHYRDSVEDAIKTVAQCEELTSGAAAFRANLGNETAVRHLLPSVLEKFGQLDAVVNSASTFEHDTAATFSFAAMEKHLRANTGAAILLSQALHTHVQARHGTGAVVNLLDQKLWNQNPDFMSYTLSKAALEAANTMLALSLSPLVRVVGVAPPLGPTQLDPSSTSPEVAAAVLFALQGQMLTGTTLMVGWSPIAGKPHIQTISDSHKP